MCVCLSSWQTRSHSHSLVSFGLMQGHRTALLGQTLHTLSCGMRAGQLGQCQSFALCVLAGTMKVVRGQVRRAKTTTFTQYDPFTLLTSTWFNATNTFQERTNHCIFFFFILLASKQKSFALGRNAFFFNLSIVHCFEFSVIVLSSISVKVFSKTFIFLWSCFETINIRKKVHYK